MHNPRITSLEKDLIMDKSHKSSNVDWVGGPTRWRIHRILQNSFLPGFMWPFPFLQFFLKSGRTPSPRESSALTFIAFWGQRSFGASVTDIYALLWAEWRQRLGTLLGWACLPRGGDSELCNFQQRWLLLFLPQNKNTESALVLSWKRRLLPNISLIEQFP